MTRNTQTETRTAYVIALELARAGSANADFWSRINRVVANGDINLALTLVCNHRHDVDFAQQLRILANTLEEHGQ